MKTLSLTLFLVLICSFGFTQTAQSRKILDSLKHQLSVAKRDTNRVLIMVSLAERFREPKPDSSVVFGYQAIKLARQIHFPKGEIRALAFVGRTLIDLGNLPKSLQMQFEALQIAENNHLPIEAALPLSHIGSVYATLGNHPKALNYYQQSKAINERNHQKATGVKMNIGNILEKMNQLDSALYYTTEVYQELLQSKDNINPIIFRNFGNIHAKLGNNRLAMNYYKKSLQFYQDGSRGRTKAIVLNQIAKLFQKEKQLDSSIHYAQKALTESNLTSYKQGALEAASLLSELYETIDPKKSFQYFKIAAAAKDSLFGASQTQALQTIVVDEQVRQREIESQRLAYQNRLKQYLLLAGLSVFFIIAFILYRNNQKEKKAKNLLQEQKDKVESTLSQLKSTQAQLIQSEKLASLGELTAGIAHEIQNPLNFVNNFSELSVDLIKEIQDERKKTIEKRDELLVNELLDDLAQNQEKINHHGKRASSIVKGMLEHSRASTGVKELTDINALADEYLRLAYHGLRAKDSSFNSDFKTDFDENLPKIEVIPQDIGRVLLNLINNAFYAVREVEKPLVVIKTEQTNNQVIIKVTDNGTGMTDEVKAKIFQPFFTTKPTGQGTGLGLSLTYDIVTKGHGGTLEVESTEGVGTTFIITF
ncbi:ATP-binding protein [Emticicia sp.]|uniref:tetratricopeptide repeat-containing sensor histidine kinase n=1 Tax=Emticicia sp. TaxID=1930953 RepID=UPI00375316A4